MHTVIVAGLRTFFSWLLGQAIIKGIVLSVLAGLVVVLGQWLWSLLPPYISTDALNTVFSSLPAGVWWILDFFRVTWGAPLLVSATVIAFLIRRIPVVG